MAKTSSRGKAPAKKKPASKRAATKPASRPAGKAKRGGARASVSPKTVTKKRQTKTAKRAKTAAQRAKAAGALGPNGTDAQRALRDSAVIARLDAGGSTKDVGSEFRLSARTVLDIRKKRTKAASPLDAIPMDILEGLAKDYRSQVADFEAMAWRHADLNPNVAIGAMKGALVARERFVELLNVVGKLPDNLELFRAEMVLRRLADEMIETMERVESGEITPADAAAFFRALITNREGEQQRTIGAGA
jgi:hypothetical protein